MSSTRWMRPKAAKKARRILNRQANARSHPKNQTPHAHPAIGALCLIIFTVLASLLLLRFWKWTTTHETNRHAERLPRQRRRARRAAAAVAKRDVSEWLCAPDNRFDLIAPPPPRLDRRTRLLFSKDEFDLFVNDRGFVPQRRVDDTARAQAAKAYQKSIAPSGATAAWSAHSVSDRSRCGEATFAERDKSCPFRVTAATPDRAAPNARPAAKGHLPHRWRVAAEVLRYARDRVAAPRG